MLSLQHATTHETEPEPTNFQTTNTNISNTELTQVRIQNPCSPADWTAWVVAQTAFNTRQHPAGVSLGIPADYGLGQIAHFLGPIHVQAHELALEGAASEADGDVRTAMKRYAAAYRLWPNLDSVHAGGLPIEVRHEALAAGYLEQARRCDKNERSHSRNNRATATLTTENEGAFPSPDDNSSYFRNAILDVVDVHKAQNSRAICTATTSAHYIQKPLFDDQDIHDLLELRRELWRQEPQSTSSLSSSCSLSSSLSSVILANNPENREHARQHKVACMMNHPPDYLLQARHPSIVGRLFWFAQKAWEDGDWSGPNGPLHNLQQSPIAAAALADEGPPWDISALSVRVVELWEYSVGGGLTDRYHYDTDSIVTIVVLLSEPGEDFDGGAFQTFEAGDIHQSYPMGKGDAVAFVSHKYHNITPVTRGCRRSLVMELWQGGVGHTGR